MDESNGRRRTDALNSINEGKRTRGGRRRRLGFGRWSDGVQLGAVGCRALLASSVGVEVGTAQLDAWHGHRAVDVAGAAGACSAGRCRGRLCVRRARLGRKGGERNGRGERERKCRGRRRLGKPGARG